MMINNYNPIREYGQTIMHYYYTTAFVKDIKGYASAIVMLAFILGGKIESYFRMGVSYGKGDYSLFFTRPISLIFILITVYSLFGPMIRKALKKKTAQGN